MKHLALWIGVVWSMSAFAFTAEEAQLELVPEGVSAFDAIDRLYDDENARPPAPQELMEWQAGRCFHVERKSRPLAGLLLTVRENDGGPLFPDDNVYKLRVKARAGEANYFDEVSRERRAELVQEYDGMRTQIGRTRVVDASLASLYNPENFPVLRKIRKLRLNGRTYYLARLVTQTEQAQGGRTYPEGTTFGTCYFFKPVR